MGRFRLTCCKCGSDKILEKSSREKVACEGSRTIYGKGIRRKCIDCDNEDFAIFETWEE